MSYQLLSDDRNYKKTYMTNQYSNAGALLQSRGGSQYDIHNDFGSMYARKSERSDIYGNNMPLIDKTFGNLYDMGPSYIENVEEAVPDNTYQYSWNQKVDNQSKVDKQEEFTVDDKSDIYDKSDTYTLIPENKSKKQNVFLFVMFIVLSISVYYWIRSANSFITGYIFTSGLDLKWLVLLAMIFTILFAMMYYKFYQN